MIIFQSGLLTELSGQEMLLTLRYRHLFIDALLENFSPRVQRIEEMVQMQMPLGALRLPPNDLRLTFDFQNLWALAATKYDTFNYGLSQAQTLQNALLRIAAVGGTLEVKDYGANANAHLSAAAYSIADNVSPAEWEENVVDIPPTPWYMTHKKEPDHAP